MCFNKRYITTCTAAQTNIQLLEQICQIVNFLLTLHRLLLCTLLTQHLLAKKLIHGIFIYTRTTLLSNRNIIGQTIIKIIQRLRNLLLLTNILPQNFRLRLPTTITRLTNGLTNELPTKLATKSIHTSTKRTKILIKNIIQTTNNRRLR